MSPVISHVVWSMCVSSVLLGEHVKQWIMESWYAKWADHVAEAIDYFKKFEISHMFYE